MITQTITAQAVILTMRSQAASRSSANRQPKHY
jgi:hypothetical protein